MKTTDLGNDWYANEHEDGSMTLRNPEKGQRMDLPADSVLRLRRIIVQAAMALVDKTLLDAFAEPMSDDEKAARELGLKLDRAGVALTEGRRGQRQGGRQHRLCLHRAPLRQKRPRQIAPGVADLRMIGAEDHPQRRQGPSTFAFRQSVLPPPTRLL